MYKVFLVDDEIAIREGIRGAGLWSEGTFSLIGEAPDGEVALPMLQDGAPDILITDIRMPFMDGMELCAEVRRLMPWMKVIILSGYDDFNYARQAMSLGVQEYLLKPVSAQELGEALHRVKAHIDNDRRNRLSIEKMQRRFAGSNRFLKEKLMTAVLFDPLEDGHAQQLLEQLRAIGINLVAKCYVVVDLAYAPETGERDAERDALGELAESNKGTVHICNGKHGSLALVLGDNAADIEERAYAFARSAVGELERMNAKNILATVGEMVPDFSDISRSVTTARHIRHVVMAKGAALKTSRIVGMEEMADDDLATESLEVRPLYEGMQYATVDDVAGILSEYARSLGAADIHSDVAADYFHVEALMTAMRIVREVGGEPREVLDAAEYERNLLLRGAKGVCDIGSATALFVRALEYRDAHDTTRGSGPVAKARAYMAQHFTDPNLMLQDVAEVAEMSNSRFSTVFSQKTGMTFTEHLAALRIGKAQELLRATDMKSSQIAYAVGYNDPHYFSYLFKKNVGLTPSEYRRENTNEQI